LSYGLYEPGSPTSLSDTSFLRSDLDLKAAEPASCDNTTMVTAEKGEWETSGGSSLPG
jgi:hypothetical protein